MISVRWGLFSLSFFFSILHGSIGAIRALSCYRQFREVIDFPDMATLTDIGTLIVRTPETCGGRPRIAGSRITVQYILKEVQSGISVEEILADKPFLTRAGIYSALAYYYANQALLDAEFAAHDEECRRWESEYSLTR